MDAPALIPAARALAEAEEKRPALVARAVAARLRRSLVVPETHHGSEFDRAMREKLTRFEQGERIP